MLNKIQKWLSNPKRKYSEGIAYFNSLASKKQKETFEKYLNAVDGDIDQYDKDGRFPMLVNQIVFIEKRIKSNPDLFAQAQVQLDVITPIKLHLQDDKPIDPGKLPDDYTKERERLKEIVPIMAKLHADMANEIADDKRMVLLRELVVLDDERRAIWKSIDGKIEPSEEELELEKLSLATGARIGKRIAQLKENISRNEKSLQTATEKNNKTGIDKITKKLYAYNSEMTELEAALER